MRYTFAGFMFFVTFVFQLVVSAPPEQLREFAAGDVLVAVAGGQVEWHNPDGSLYRTLDTKVGGSTAGLAFNPINKNLFVTNIAANTVTSFDPLGNLLGRFGAVYEVGPASILFDNTGSVYVGQASGQRLIKLDAGGHFVKSFNIAVDDRGFTWIDLAPDQCTLYYTTNGRSVKRFDVCKTAQMPDFAANLPWTAYALRLLPGGGMLVADSQQVLRLDANGSPAQIYAQGQYDWFAMNLDPDGRSFWSTDRSSNGVFKFDIATGKQMLNFKVSPDAKVGGLAVFGEITAVQPPLPPPTLTPPPPIPTQIPTLPPVPTSAPILPPVPPPTRVPPIPSPAPRPSDGALLFGGFGVVVLVALFLITVLALAVVRRLARPGGERAESQNDRVDHAERQVHVQSHDDPGRQIVLPEPHPPTPIVRLRLGQGKADDVVETASRTKPEKE